MKTENINIELLNMIGDVKNKGDMRVWIEYGNGNINDKISILHTAGVLDDKLIINQNWKSFKKVMYPKIMDLNQ